MPKTCPRCGTSCGDAQAFCPRCGAQLSAAQQPPYGQRPPQGQQQPPYGQRPPQGQPPYGQRPPQGHPPYGQQGPGGMTVAPSLLTGLKRLYTSTVLQLVGYGIIILGLIVIIAAGAGAITSSSYSQLRGAAGGAIIGIILIVIAAIVVLIGIIFNIIGVITVSKENEKFKIAFYAVLTYLVCLILSLLITFNGGNSTLASILSTLSSVANAVVFVFVCTGIKEVGTKLGFADFLGSYNGVVITYLIGVGLSFIGGLISSGASLVLMGLGVICSIVAFFLYMGYLRKAIRAVSGAPGANPYQQPRY